MAQTGYTPILIYSSSTASNLPSASNLTNSTLGSELAINIADGKLFYKDTSNAVQVIGWKVTPTSAGGTGLTSYTAGDMLYYASGTALSKLAIGATGRYMSSSGTAPQWTAPAALTKTDDTNVTLTLGGSASTALLNAASLTLGWTGTLAVSRGGTGTGTAFTAGSVVFAGASGVYSQDNANLFWDDSNNRLGIKTATPAYALDVVDNTTGVQSRILSSSSSGTSFAMVNTATNGRSFRIGNNFVVGNGEWSLYDDTAGATRIQVAASGGVSIGNTTDPGATNLSVTGLVSAARFVPTGSTVPTNGMYLPATNTVGFATNSIAAFQVDSGQNIQIGTTNNSDTAGDGIKFWPNGGIPRISMVGNSTSNGQYPIMVRASSNNTWRMYVDWAGNIYAQNTSITSLSDERLKENIRDLDTGLQTILALKPRRFDWKEGKGQEKKDVAGFIAQEVELVLPEIITTGLDEDENGDKYKMIAPGMLIPMLVKAIQEQQQIIEQLKADMAAIKGN